MGKTVKKIAIGAAIIGVGIATGGIGLVGTATVGSFTAATGAAVTLGTALSTTMLGGALLSLGGSMILGGLAQGVAGKPKASPAQLSRLSASLDPATPRKLVFGETALPLDIRYYYPSGTNQDYVDYIIACAAHELESIDEIWFEDRLAWTSALGVQAYYSGYLTVATRTAGTSANTISISSAWGAAQRLTGCAYLHLRIKRTGNSKKAESPLVNGLPNRVTAIGKGMKLYDPRLDSTNGGTGTHRPGDQTTWTGTAGNRDNPALQALAYLLGWKIGGKLSVGCGIPPARLDLSSFITAANVCDESVALAAGGTQERYRGAGVFSEADGRMSVLETMLTACNGTLRDAGGRLSIAIIVNDLATPAIALDDNDMLSPFVWNQTQGLGQTVNMVRGKWTDPSDNALYQPSDYPSVSIASVDGIERVMPLDLPMVQNVARAQRIAKQALQRAQYQGTIEAEFNARALAAKVGDVVTLSNEAMGWSAKLFRVMAQTVRQDGVIPMVLREEHANIYAWAAEDTAGVVAAAPTLYDQLNSPFILGAAEAGAAAAAAQAAADAAQATADGKIDSFYQAGPPAMALAGIGDFWIDTDDNNRLYRHMGMGLLFGGVEVTFGGTSIDMAWVMSDDQRISSALTSAAGAQATADGKITTFYSEIAPIAGGDGDLWYQASTKTLKRWNALIYNWEVSSPVGVFDYADVTATATPSLYVPSSETFYADYQGVLTPDQVPTSLICIRKRGAVDVSSATTWSIVPTPGITATIDIAGIITIEDVANSGNITVTSLHDGVTLKAAFPVEKLLGAPPSPSTTVASDNSIGSVSSATYGTAHGGPLTVIAGAAGTVSLTAPLTFYATAAAPVASLDLYGKWQYRAAGGGSWTDVATEILSLVPCDIIDEGGGIYSKNDGLISVEMAKTGLTDGVWYEFQLLLRTDAGTRSRHVVGVATASAS